MENGEYYAVRGHSIEWEKTSITLQTIQDEYDSHSENNIAWFLNYFQEYNWVKYIVT